VIPRSASLVLAFVLAAGCGSTAPTAPASAAPLPSKSSGPITTPAVTGVCVIGFDDLVATTSAFAETSACGLRVAATAATWQVSTGYGHPAPFVWFFAEAGKTVPSEIEVTAAGARFVFVSVDIYSSTTKIPYEILGEARGETVFSMRGTQGNTFGNFATLTSTNTGAIERLKVRLTNPAAPCCTNPMGLDNIRVGQPAVQ
jgi:hypothetical protein